MEPSNRFESAGRLLFGGGIVLLVLRGLALTTHFPGLPSFWYHNQSLWVAIGIAMTAAGWQLQWGQPKTATQPWQPTVSGRRFRVAKLYIGEGCHLCEEAGAVLKEYQRWLPAVVEIDIRTDLRLVERFGTCIPVVEFDGKVRFRGRVNEALLRRLIEGTPPL